MDNLELMLEVSKRLAGVKVYPGKESITAEEYLLKVADAKLEKTGGMITAPGTKSLIMLRTQEEKDRYKRAIVSKWLAFGRGIPNSRTGVDVLKALINYQER